MSFENLLRDLNPEADPEKAACMEQMARMFTQVLRSSTNVESSNPERNFTAWHMSSEDRTVTQVSLPKLAPNRPPPELLKLLEGAATSAGCRTHELLTTCDILKTQLVNAYRSYQVGDNHHVLFVPEKDMQTRPGFRFGLDAEHLKARVFEGNGVLVCYRSSRSGRLRAMNTIQRPYVEWVEQDSYERVSTALHPFDRAAWSAENDEAPRNSKCAQCKTVSSQLLTCSACKRVMYCDRACQKKHWRLHKMDCKK